MAQVSIIFFSNKKGSFTSVYKALHKKSGEMRAVKVVEISKVNNEILEQIEQEISILRKLDHPNIIKLYEIYQDEKYYYLVMEYFARVV